MRKAIKKNGVNVKAYQLGTPSFVLDDLISEGKIKKISDDTYEIFSQETQGGVGQVAHKGDFIKIDSQGVPYPNDRVFFEENHRHIRGDFYEQIPKVVETWEANEQVCSEIDFLIDKKGLKLRPDNEDQYFEAELWGTQLTAAKDAVVMFYRIDRNDKGEIIDADFNFSSREEFDKNYKYLNE